MTKPSRDFLVRQACLNVHDAYFWRGWWNGFEPDWTAIRQPLYATRRAIATEFNKLVEQYS